MAGLLGGRIAATRRTAVLAAGDAAMIAIFVALGELQHGGSVAAGVETFLQFAVGWSVVAVPLGAYGPHALRSAPRAAGRAAGTWIAGALVGQVVRATVRPGFYVAPAFVVVSIVVGGALLAAWRAAMAARE